jgi:hypothetical protein
LIAIVETRELLVVLHYTRHTGANGRHVSLMETPVERFRWLPDKRAFHPRLEVVTDPVDGLRPGVDHFVHDLVRTLLDAPEPLASVSNARDPAHLLDEGDHFSELPVEFAFRVHILCSYFFDHF